MKKGNFSRIRYPSFLLTAALILSLLAGGCGSSSSDSSAVAETAAVFENDSQQNMAAASESGAGASAGITSSFGSPSGTDDSDSFSLERKLIRTVSMNVETTEFDALITSIQENVSRLKGYIQQSDISGNSITEQGRSSGRYGSMTIRIPADSLNDFVTQVEADGNVTYKSENVSDVTLQYSDVESRLKTLRTEQERLWELLAIADTTEAIIALEERLTEVTIEIESSESRLRYLDNSVTYSTVTLSIDEVDTESPTQPENIFQQIRRGFSQNLSSLLSFLSAAVIGILSGSPTLIFILLMALLTWLLFKKLPVKIRRGRKKKLHASEDIHAVLQEDEEPDSEKKS